MSVNQVETPPVSSTRPPEHSGSEATFTLQIHSIIRQVKVHSRKQQLRRGAGRSRAVRPALVSICKYSIQIYVVLSSLNLTRTLQRQKRYVKKPFLSYEADMK